MLIMSLSSLQPHVKITIDLPGAESNSAFGPGIASLCRGVRDTGSLNAAAKGMGMAYSKAWRIVKDTEAALETQLLIRDGARGSTLTEEGLKLLSAYDELQAIVQKYGEETFHKLVS